MSSQPDSERSEPRRVNAGAVVLIGFGATAVLAGLLVPVLLLHNADAQTRSRWAEIGEAVAPIGVLYAGLAFLGIVLTLIAQRRELHNQREELAVALDGQRRATEVALRQVHTELIRMALEDPELEEVWPPLAPGVPETKKDHYCNLILNLQKVAYEAGTIELPELKGMLDYLMRSPDVYDFWTKARAPRAEVTTGDPGEDFFTGLVDDAYQRAPRPPRPPVLRRVSGRLRSLVRRLQAADGGRSARRFP